MLDIIGNIKIEENKPNRVDYLIACLRSWQFFKEHCKFYLYIDNVTPELHNKIYSLQNIGLQIEYFPNHAEGKNYGEQYCKLLKKGQNPFVLNFIEDHFTILDDAEKMMGILNTMQEHNVQVLKTSFLQVEQNSQKSLRNPIDTPYGRIFDMNEKNYVQYGKHYGGRYMIGVNFLTTRDFALKFWNRDMGHRPHEYEIAEYNNDWFHRCMIPAIEVQASIEDDHGEDNTCLLKRNEEKWNRIYKIEISEFTRPVKEEIKEELHKDKSLIMKENIEVEKIIVKKLEKQISIPTNQYPKSFLFNDLISENKLFENDILEKMDEVYGSGQYLLGDQSKDLEKRFSNFIGKKYCVTVKNGTDALILSLKYALKYRPDAKVIIPNFGAYPTAIAVKNCTDNIHFIDVDETLTIDIKKLPEDIKDGIIIPVHLFGNNCNMKSINKYALKNNHIIIEDCAQSTGSRSGQHGDFSCFSFYPTKPLGTIGDGGAICTDDEEAYMELLHMRNYGINKEGLIETHGINSRMGELECAIVNAKLDKFETLIEKKRTIINRYTKIVHGIHVNSNCVYHQFTVLFHEREKVIKNLNEAQIPYMIHYAHHISDMPVFKHLYHETGFRVNDKIISLPCHAFMTEEQIQQVEQFLQNNKQYEY